jgi:hypothetical protein
MANLNSLVINDTGSLNLPGGTSGQRPIVTTTVTSFTTVGTTAWVAPTGVSEIEVLVVAGGGGGGRYGAGGGAGGLLYRSNYPVTAGSSYIVTIGAGGAGHVGDAQSGGTAANGGNSQFDTLIALGGGGGGNYSNGSFSSTSTSGANGGSGGGSGTNGPTYGLTRLNTPGQGVLGQGNRGGFQAIGYGAGGGGGGGAGKPGEDAPNGGPGGRGGDGLNFSISGTPTWYAGGGGGGGNNDFASTVITPGGLGGGGVGLPPGASTTAIDGTPNTGGGGGGGADNNIGGTTRAGNGGSGIVILRYIITDTVAQTRYNSTADALEVYSSENVWKSQETNREIINQGLIFHLDAARYSSGATINDISGNNKNFTIIGAVTYTSEFGGSWVLDQSNDQRLARASFYGTDVIGISPSTVSNWNGTSTYEGWVYPTTLDGTARHAWTDSNFNEGELEFRSTGITVYWGGSTTINYNATIVPNQWYHIAVTHEQDTRTDRYIMKFYVNGRLAGFSNATPIVGTASSYGPDGQLNIGYQFIGRIAAVRMYSSAFSENDIIRNYNAQCERFNKEKVEVQTLSTATPGVVSDGLIIHLDATNKASYPGYGEIWNNLANGPSGRLSGVKIVNGYAEFTAQSHNIIFNSYTIARDKTLSFWLRTNRPLSDQDNWQIGWLENGSANGLQFGMMYGVGQTTDLGFWGRGAEYDFSIDSPSSRMVPANTWTHITLCMDYAYRVTVYRNGIQQRLYRNSDASIAPFWTLPGNTNATFRIESRGVWNTGFTYLWLNDILAYDRTIGFAEIKQNFEAQRKKYGI